jgi:two-component system sensor histidine kinase DesK
MPGDWIAWSIDSTIEPLPPASDAMLAWAVREGVTNVVRHSRARQCHIRVNGENGKARVEVINDGYPGQPPDASPVRTGSGLSGLAERVTAQGGGFESGPCLFKGVPGFHLQVEIPIRDRASDEREEKT